MDTESTLKYCVYIVVIKARLIILHFNLKIFRQYQFTSIRTILILIHTDYGVDTLSKCKNIHNPQALVLE